MSFERMLDGTEKPTENDIGNTIKQRNIIDSCISELKAIKARIAKAIKVQVPEKTNNTSSPERQLIKLFFIISLKKNPQNPFLLILSPCLQ